MECPIAHLIMTVDHHLKAGYVAQSHSPVNHYEMIYSQPFI